MKVAVNESSVGYAHDARLVAAMIRHNVTHVLTFNVADFARFNEVTAVTPDAVVTGSASLGDE